MKTPLWFKAILPWGFLFSSAILVPGSSKPDADVARFIAAKRRQVEQSARAFTNPVPSAVWKMFDAAAAGNWRSTSNLFNIVCSTYKPVERGEEADRQPLPPEVWYPIQEVGGFCEMFTFTDPKYIRLFADEIFKVVPPGSVFFGGTDCGRFIITALSTSHAEGKPFFTITQNQLVATNYLKYVQDMYGKQLKIPGADSTALAFSNYLADTTRRLEHDRQFPNEPKQIQPGEEVRMVGGQVQASGQTAVMAVNGLVAKDLFNANSDREFYIEESFPLDWMFPYLVPTGPIFKLQHTRLDSLPQDSILKDRQYWTSLMQRLLGLKLQEDASVAQVCTFAEDPKPQGGEKAFLGDRQARNTFAKLRSASASLYAWYANHALGSADRRRMNKEAEVGFKQAYCLSPRSPEAIYRFTMFLFEQGRLDDVRTFVSSAKKMNPDDPYVDSMVQWSKQNR